jgi:hypothetical protein
LICKFGCSDSESKYNIEIKQQGFEETADCQNTANLLSPDGEDTLSGRPALVRAETQLFELLFKDLILKKGGGVTPLCPHYIGAPLAYA